jgi:predicted GNAT family N-acyltransferase
MTLDEKGRAIAHELRKMKDARDPEMAHIEADEMLVKFVRELGFDEIADAFDDVPKWYS